MKPIRRALRSYLSAVEETVRRLVVGTLDPRAYEFYARLVADGYEPNRHIDVLPKLRVIYICVPKCATSRIKVTLSEAIGRPLASFSDAHNRRRSGLKAPKHVGLSRFLRLATDPRTLRFSFVRNPYDRLVSCWADKFRDKPLVAGDPYVDMYLAWRWPPVGEHLNHVEAPPLSFAEFVAFATATAGSRADAHWSLQSEFLRLPGMALDFVGKVESFAEDFQRVLDHVGADESLRQRALLPLNATHHDQWSSYYTSELAEQVYRAYERDFDCFGYPRAL